jgi:peptide chain release factor 2
MQLDLGPRIAALRSTLGDVVAVVDVDGLRARIVELEARASAPDLWDDPEAAQKVTS